MQSIDINKMNTEEKFIMMEQLWDSLSDENSIQLSPDWHLEVLEEREHKTNFIDIEESKKALESLLKK